MRGIASVLIAALLLCTGCAPQQKPTGELSLSKDILFSIYYPGDGEGTVAMCAGAAICPSAANSRKPTESCKAS